MADDELKLGAEAKPPLLTSGRTMATLTVVSGEGVGQRIECRRVACLIGSRRGCKINLQHPGVAPIHVAIVHLGDRILARDLTSVRGSRLNGLPLVQEELADGDVLAVGPWEFHIDISTVSGGARMPAHPDLEPTPREFSLEHVATRRCFQPTREVCVIGRRSRCDIAIDDPEVSRVHAIVFRHDERPAVMDLLASAPLRVNGDHVGFHYLDADDVLTIGGSEFKVRFPRQLSPGPSANGHKPEGILAPPVPVRDLIDIRAVESTQRWSVADHVERYQREDARQLNRSGS